MNRVFKVVALAAVLLMGGCTPALSQTAVDSVVCTKCVPVVVTDTVVDTLKVPAGIVTIVDTFKVVQRVDTLWKDSTTVVRVDTTWTDSLVLRTITDTTWRDSVIIGIPVVVGNEPPGMRPIVQIDFGPNPLGISYVSGPAASVGVVMGKARSESSAKITAVPGGYAHRQTFGVNAVTGRGVGGSILAKENLVGNTDGNTTHSYRLYYERSVFYFGGAKGEPNFENTGSDGFKLLGYWGGMCPGNINATQIIGWAAPAANRVDFSPTLVTPWRLQIRFNNACASGAPQSWFTTASGNWPTFTAGTWHTLEAVFDAGDIGVANGSLKFYVDGVLVGSYKGLLRTASAPRGFLGRHWNPVLNGRSFDAAGCTSAGQKLSNGHICAVFHKTRADVLDVNSIYISVAQQID